MVNLIYALKNRKKIQFATEENMLIDWIFLNCFLSSSFLKFEPLVQEIFPFEL